VDFYFVVDINLILTTSEHILMTLIRGALWCFQTKFTQSSFKTPWPS